MCAHMESWSKNQWTMKVWLLIWPQHYLQVSRGHGHDGGCPYCLPLHFPPKWVSRTPNLLELAALPSLARGLLVVLVLVQNPHDHKVSCECVARAKQLGVCSAGSWRLQENQPLLGRQKGALDQHVSGSQSHIPVHILVHQSQALLLPALFKGIQPKVL